MNTICQICFCFHPSKISNLSKFKSSNINLAFVSLDVYDFSTNLLPFYETTCVWRHQLQEKSAHTNKHQGIKCEKAEDRWGVEKSRENAEKGNIHGCMCAAMQFSQWPVSPVGRLCMHHHLITHRPAWTPSSHRPPPPPCCCRSSHITTASHQNDPPPHISAQVWAHSWVLDTDLTRGPSVGWLVAWQADGWPACQLKLFCCLTGRHFDGAEVIADRRTKMCCWEIFLDVRGYFDELVGWFDILRVRRNVLLLPHRKMYYLR